MRWLEQTIRRYEHGRWTVDGNRRVLPFEWGLEHIGGPAIRDAREAREFLTGWADQTIAQSDAWFACEPAADYGLADGILTFTSAIRSPWPENNTVVARFFRARLSGPGVVVLPQWNAKWEAQVDICRWLNRVGITVLLLSLPYHHRRAVPGHERADHLVGPNIGLTLQANRQAVTDLRLCLRWLEQRGYGKLGVVGTSVGSSIAFVTMAHEPAIRAGAFLHVSTLFGDVVRTGMTTSHVWESLRARVTAEEINRYWAPISPFPYVSRVRGTGQRPLLISGKYDPTFLPEFSNSLLAMLRNDGIPHESLRLPCGHYSLGEAPFKWLVGLRFITFLFESLT